MNRADSRQRAFIRSLLEMREIKAPPTNNRNSVGEGGRPEVREMPTSGCWESQ